ncbi:MAG: SprB repeat-containing protein, partial [Bacteroidota bacterium]
MLSKNAACPAMVRDSVFVEGLPSLVSVTPLGGVCGQEEIDVEVVVTGGIPPYQITYPTLSGSSSVSTSNTIITLSGVKTGSEIFTVEDSRGLSCSGTDIFFIESPGLSIEANITNVTCYNDGTGSIDVTVSNAAGPITFQWSTADTTLDLQNLNGGDYILTVSDSLCTVTETFSVQTTTYQNTTATISPTNCEGENGAINLMIQGGQSPYTFQWSNGATTEDISGIFAGGYAVNVTDANGCLYHEVFDVPPAKMPLISSVVAPL